MEQVIVDYVYPLLSVLKDGSGVRYLCMCFDTRGAQQWLITPVSTDALAALLENKITLAAPFEEPHTRKFLVNLNYQTRAETCQVLDASQIPEEDLPEAGEYLDAEPGEWDTYIGRLKTAACQIRNSIRWDYPNGRASVKWSDIPRYPGKVGRYVICTAG